MNKEEALYRICRGKLLRIVLCRKLGREFYRMEYTNGGRFEVLLREGPGKKTNQHIVG